MIIPSDLNNIQPRATKLWKYDEIGFHPNRRLEKVILFTSSSNVKECGRCKLDSEPHYGVRYFFLPDMMVNISYQP